MTTVTKVRDCWFVDEDVCKKTLLQFEKYRIKNHVQCYGYVLMPDHLHALLVQDQKDSSVADMIRDFKRETTKRLTIEGYTDSSLWRSRYDDVPVPGSEAAMTKLVYMLNNPVRSNLVSDPCDYLWSSASDHYDLGKGLLL